MKKESEQSVNGCGQKTSPTLWMKEGTRKAYNPSIDSNKLRLVWFKQIILMVKETKILYLSVKHFTFIGAE